MKKFCAAFLVVIFGLLSAFAQQQPPQNDKAVYGDYSFDPAREEFSIAASPVVFVDRNQPTTDANRFTIEKENRRYTAQAVETRFYIFSDAPKKPEQYKFVLNFMNGYNPSATSVYANEAPGERFAFADADGYFHKILIVKTDRRVYVFQTVSSKDANAEVERFFAGIRFNHNKSAAQTAPAPERLEDDKTTALPTTETVIPQKFETAGTGRGGGSGRGIGDGSGRGSGDGIGSGAGSGVNQGASGRTEKFKILSKPRPAGYTDLARFYEILGVVRVRVAFLETGEIGAVTPVTKLPFGLTGQAVEAARGIQFAPATRDGKSFTTIATIEYRFTIY